MDRQTKRLAITALGNAGNADALQKLNFSAKTEFKTKLKTKLRFKPRLI